ncbi:MAG: LysR family transcriptional regulator, partial [Alphaproteobacteria bacterium]|nr:LysR family transcriptional regulator [Alphaproteobacteria bacterium]
MLPISLKQLETFVAVAEARSFRRAAERLLRSQSAISAHIQNLEEELGVALLHRTTRSVRLTEAGARLLVQAREVVARLDAVVVGLREEEAMQRGRFVIACTPSCAANLLPDILRDYHARFPKITIEVIETYAYGVQDALRREEAELGFGPFDRTGGEFEFRQLLDDPYAVIMSRDYRLASRKRLVVADIVDEPILMMPKESAVYRMLENLFAAEGRTMRPRYELVHHQTLFALVAVGLGVTVMPAMALPADSAERLHAVDLIRPRISRKLGLITLRGQA